MKFKKSVSTIAVLFAVALGGVWLGVRFNEDVEPAAPATRPPAGASAPASAEAPRAPVPASAAGAVAAVAVNAPHDSAHALPAPLMLGHRWSQERAPEMAAFRDWTTRYRATTHPVGRAALESEGVTLARARRALMHEWIRNDPRRALAATVPWSVRRELPAAVLAALEQRVSGSGDLALNCAQPRAGARESGELLRTGTIDGTTYRVHTYGRRDAQATRVGLSMFGVAVESDLALHPDPARLIEAGEDVGPAVCAVTGAPIDAASAEAVRFEAHGRKLAVSSAAQFDVVMGRLLAAEGGPLPEVEPVFGARGELLSAVEPLPPTAWTTGPKQVLVIRVDFSDFPGEPVSTTDAATLIDGTVNTYYSEASYATTSMSATVSPAVYRMPQTGASYAVADTFEQLHTDARNLAVAQGGYTLANYDRIVVAFRDLGTASVPGSKFTWAGLANVAGANLWINGNFNFRTVAHELGHTFGLRHANLWQVSGGDPIAAAGFSSEYGDPFDVMGGGAGVAGTHHFNPWFKNRLGWIPDSSVTQVTASGTYRIARFDHPGTTLSQPLALNIFRDGVRSYWVGLRKNFPSSPTIDNGAFLFWGYYSQRASSLLDMTTPGTNVLDAGLAAGSTLNDTLYGVTIQSVATGGTAPNEYLDVTVTLNRPTQNYPAAWGDPLSTESGPMGLFNVQQVAGGFYHNVALKSDGTVVAWGRNSNGESTVPAGLSGVVAIAAGDDLSGAVKSDGTIALWGDTTDGQLDFPADLTPVARLAIGADHVVALKRDGTVLAWGDNSHGEATVPGGLTGVIGIAAGLDVSLALKSDGTVVRWGANYGAMPAGLSGVVKIASGDAHHLAIKSDGTVAVWGNNAYQQLNLPVGLTNVVDIAGGGLHSVALKSDGTVVCWGTNNNLQSEVPAGLPYVGAVGAGNLHSIVIVGTPAAAVTVLTQPSSTTVIEGQDAQFTIEATGTPPLTYQWQRMPAGGAFTNIAEGAPYSGTTSTTLTVSGATLAMSGDQFRCVVTSSGTLSVNSATASLTVQIPPPVISTQPLAQSIAAGQGLTLSVVATGAGTLTYQWQLNGVDIAGATSSTYSLRRGQAFHAGTYRVIVGNGMNSTTSNGAVVTVNPPPASDARLMNISTRGLSLTGSELLIPGFVVEGTGSKRLLLRAVGPSLGALGVGGTIDDPRMVLKKWNPAIPPNGDFEDVTSNDNWGTNANAAAIATAALEVGAFPLATGSADAALLVDLGPGRYSVVASGVSDTTGVAIVEAYDADSGSPATRLVNISNRGFVGTGSNIMIPGFVVSNEGSRTFLIRAVGPTLGGFGVGGTLADPVLDVFERIPGTPPSDVLILSNDNWDGIAGSTTTASVAADVGAFALTAGSADAAFVVTLPPGIYTVNARGKDNTTGIALVEVYLVP